MCTWIITDKINLLFFVNRYKLFVILIIVRYIFYKAMDNNTVNNDTLDTTESKEIHRVVKKKVVIKAKSKVRDLDLSKYGYRRQARIFVMFALYSKAITNDDNIDIEGIILDFADFKDGIVPENIKMFSKTLLEGTIKYLEEIDELIVKYSEHWELSRIQSVDKAILRMSIYSLMYQRDIPSSVVIDEAIEIAKDFSEKDSYKFINGILDGIREKELQ